MFLAGTLIVLFPFILVYLWLVNRAAMRVPDEVKKASPHRWTKREIKETLARLEKSPIDFTPHLPPKQERRYIVVGSSGLVGGYMVLHLLQRGQSPETVRTIDCAPPRRSDMLRGSAANVPFFQADITSEDSIRAAFDQPWPRSVAKLPLTVLHPAALINFTDRARSLLHKVNAVNLTGTANVISAAKKAGADVFISTSSGSVELKPISFWIWPWERYPHNFSHFIDGRDAQGPLRSHYDYFSNYAVSKAHAEKLVMAANTPEFRTGVIRPANGAYGTRYDQTIGTYLTRGLTGPVPAWVTHIVQNFVNAEHVSLAHLKYEEALRTPNHQVGGKCYVITDPNPAISFGDIYNLLETCAITPFKIQCLPLLPLVLLAYLVEGYTLLRESFPTFKSLLPNLPGDMAMLQPTLFSISCAHVIASDAMAQKSIAEGGIGFKHVCSTLEAMCMEVMRWNEEHKDKFPQQRVDEQISGEMKNIDAVPSALAM